jgi:hypothetical protein
VRLGVASRSRFGVLASNPRGSTRHLRLGIGDLSGDSLPQVCAWHCRTWRTKVEATPGSRDDDHYEMASIILIDPGMSDLTIPPHRSDRLTRQACPCGAAACVIRVHRVSEAIRGGWPERSRAKQVESRRLAMSEPCEARRVEWLPGWDGRRTSLILLPMLFRETNPHFSRPDLGHPFGLLIYHHDFLQRRVQIKVPKGAQGRLSLVDP